MWSRLWDFVGVGVEELDARFFFNLSFAEFLGFYFAV